MQCGPMEMLLALLLQSATAAHPGPAPAPRLSYVAEAADEAPRPRVNQGRSFRADWNALDQSLATEARQERRPPAGDQSAPARQPPRRTTQWNGVQVRMIDGRPHGLW